MRWPVMFVQKDESMEERGLELLAPAGSLESLKAAVQAGADAVYMGGTRFGARAYAENPGGEALLEAIDYAHLYGVKLYLTVNTLLKDAELEQELYEYLRPCYERGVDAVLVQDMGVLAAIREWFPDLPVHASTQMNLCGSGSVRLLEEAGVSRAVLARELSLAEIARIHQETGMELETFVHGALCYCYSGQCLFSSILGGRSGNRGRCAQPCRLSYEALDHGNPVSGKAGKPLLSPKDICTLDLIPRIAEAGVYSLKIEGRMKRPEYAAGVVRIYRKYIDRYLKDGKEKYRVDEADRRELLLLFNRDGFSGGYYEQHNGKNMMALSDRPAKDAEKKAYEELIGRLRASYVDTEKKIPVRGTLLAAEGTPLTLHVRGRGAEITVEGEMPQVPKTRPMEEEQICRQLMKTGNTPFVWEDLQIRMEGPLFIPVQELNRIRREALSGYEAALLAHGRRAADKARECINPLRRPVPAERTALHISVETEEQLGAVLSAAEDLRRDRIPLTAIFLEQETMEECMSELTEKVHRQGLEAWTALPHIFRMGTENRFYRHPELWNGAYMDGFLVRNPEEYMFLKENRADGRIILDHNVYTWNRRSRRFWKEQGAWMFTDPLELNAGELRAVSGEDSVRMIYGRYPMMVTAGCLHRTLDRCGKKPEVWTLRDRYAKEFPVKNYCRDCYNIIYNSQPLCLLDLEEKIRGIGAFRLSFTTEGKEQVSKVLDAWMKRERLEAEITRGHFKRGVE